MAGDIWSDFLSQADDLVYRPDKGSANLGVENLPYQPSQGGGGVNPFFAALSGGETNPFFGGTDVGMYAPQFGFNMSGLGQATAGDARPKTGVAGRAPAQAPGKPATASGGSNMAAPAGPAPAYSGNRAELEAWADQQAKRVNVDPRILKALLTQESGWNPTAQSKAGAKGIAQFMDPTAARFGLKDPFDPMDSIRASADYLDYLNKRYKGNVDLMLAGYNAGEGNVDKYGGIPPFAETQKYVRTIRALAGI